MARILKSRVPTEVLTKLKKNTNARREVQAALGIGERSMITYIADNHERLCLPSVQHILQRYFGENTLEEYLT